MERYHISGVPVVDEDGHLVEYHESRSAVRDAIRIAGFRSDDAAPLVTVPVGTTLEQAKAVLQEHRIENFW